MNGFGILNKVISTNKLQTFIIIEIPISRYDIIQTLVPTFYQTVKVFVDIFFLQKCHILFLYTYEAKI